MRRLLLVGDVELTDAAGELFFLDGQSGGVGGRWEDGQGQY
jgi:hypothetical protein